LEAVSETSEQNKTTTAHEIGVDVNQPKQANEQKFTESNPKIKLLEQKNEEIKQELKIVNDKLKVEQEKVKTEQEKVKQEQEKVKQEQEKAKQEQEKVKQEQDKYKLLQIRTQKLEQDINDMKKKMDGSAIVAEMQKMIDKKKWQKSLILNREMVK